MGSAPRPSLDTFAAEPVLAKLKDFQRDTVEYVFERMYSDRDESRHFLVADEVGLGKTMVARGLIAKVIEKLCHTVDRIDIIYVCSNADIARQNINRLQMPGFKGFARASRITLVPVEFNQFDKRLNFFALTPSAGLDVAGTLGIAKERALIYSMLEDEWDLGRSAHRHIFRGHADGSFTYAVDSFRAARKNPDQNPGWTINAEIKARFLADLRTAEATAAADSRPTLKERFTELSSRSLRMVHNEDREARNRIIGDLRGILANTCVTFLEPDLIVLDEFQRFKYLLEGEDEVTELARKLLGFRDARVLLLSATPYKMFTLDNEIGGEDHYEDFCRTLDFLYQGTSQKVDYRKLLKDYKRELYRSSEGPTDAALILKSAIEVALRKVMVRTERLASNGDRGGMLTELMDVFNAVDEKDIRTYLATKNYCDSRQLGDPIEYWKSAPYLLNFMEDGYSIKDDFEVLLSEKPSLERWASLSRVANTFLPSADILAYNGIDSGNSRLRHLLAHTVGRALWKLLWLPPSLPYYSLAGAFDDVEAGPATKKLVFSSWRVVPRVVSSLVSYEAERLMMESEIAKGHTYADRDQLRPLLRYARSDGRLSGMPVLACMYPSFALADLFDPLELLRKQSEEGLKSSEQVLAIAEARVKEALEPVIKRFAHGGGPADESWYWAAPMLLDLQCDKDATLAWLESPELEAWDLQNEDATEGEDLRQQHFAEAVRFINEPALGPAPADLGSVLAKMALAGPGVVCLRSLCRSVNAPRTNPQVRASALRMAEGFRSLFNLPEVITMLRHWNSAEPYWERVLEYGVDGCLQSVIDEYLHVLHDSVGVVDGKATTSEEAAREIAEVAYSAMTLRTIVFQVDDYRANENGKSVGSAKISIRARFAVRFGDDNQDETSVQTRRGQLKEAFNSPFWPFVLVTTSIGQEGLDFHHYCHSVVHWNLPTNPVDLEQREGRVHRFKGHAVRKNVALRHGVKDLGAEAADPWDQLFQFAASDRDPGGTELEPFWVYPVPGGASIERHVPTLPMSRDVVRYERLKRSLMVYRMVFGQARQEDLLNYLLERVPAERIRQVCEELRIDLAPEKKTAL